MRIDTKMVNDNTDKLYAAAKVVETYFKATYQGDMSAVRAVFHETATITGFLGDEFVVFSVDEFIALLSGREAPAAKNEPYDKRIIAVDVSERIATVKTYNLVGDTYFTDKINLALFNGQWKIINKLFATN